MRWLRALGLRRSTRQQREHDIDREIRAHLELEAEERQDAGLTADDARDAARRAFGRPALVREETRAAWGRPAVEAFLQDVRFGVRLLARSPVFAGFAVASLALGIAATTAIFTLFDTIVLRGLPVPEPDRLVLASFGRPGGRFNYSLPYPQFAHIRDRNTTLTGVFATYPFGRVNVAAGGDPDVAEGQYVSGAYYETLRVRPALGRLLTTADDRPGNTIAVISHGYWQRRFGGRTETVGSTIRVNGVPFTLVGVEPEGFSGTEVGRPYDINIPMRASDALREGDPLWDEAFATWIYVMGRLKPDVPIQRAEQELNGLFRQVSIESARSSIEVRLAKESILKLESGATGASSDLRFAYERWLRVVLALLGAVLLLASLNVATLLLARSEARQRELATRLALGAGRGRIVRQLLTESIVLAALAGSVGFVLSWWGSRALFRLAVPAAERLPLDLGPDIRVAAFTMAISVLTCLVFGTLPAWRVTSERRLITARQIGGGRERRLLDRALVASQVALSLALLVVAGLFVRSLGNLWAQETGYDRHGVLMFSVDSRLAGKKGDEVPATYRRLLDEMRALPGAQSVSLSAVRPVSDTYYFVDAVTTVGEKVLPEDQPIRVASNHVAASYFATLDIPLVAGRDFDDRDTLTAPKVAIISERMARHFTGGPIGQQITLGRKDVREVVGVAANTRYANIQDAPRDLVYAPMFQTEAKAMWYTPTFVIRHARRAEDVIGAARQAVTRVDAGLSPFRIRTLEAQTEESLSRERLLAMLTSYVGVFALLLSCIGLYGLMSYAVTRRTPELGIRLALGATPAAVRWLVVREGTATVLAGLVVGLAGCAGVVRLIRSLLFDVRAGDPVTLAGATFLLLAMAFAAAYLPALRASRIDPLRALRHE
jgi:predicted permease